MKAFLFSLTIFLFAAVESMFAVETVELGVYMPPPKDAPKVELSVPSISVGTGTDVYRSWAPVALRKQ